MFLGAEKRDQKILDAVTIPGAWLRVVTVMVTNATPQEFLFMHERYSLENPAVACNFLKETVNAMANGDIPTLDREFVSNAVGILDILGLAILDKRGVGLDGYFKNSKSANEKRDFIVTWLNHEIGYGFGGLVQDLAITLINNCTEKHDA